MKVNHFRGWYELCRKDMLNKNLKKFKRGLDKQNNREESDEYDFLPATFLLPSEYVIFYEEFKKTQNDSRSLWIMKPVDLCLDRLRNAREKGFSFLIKSAKSRDGNLSTATIPQNPTFVRDIFSILCFLEAESSICVFTLSAHLTNLLLSISTEQVSLVSHIKDTTTAISITYVFLLAYR